MPGKDSLQSVNIPCVVNSLRGSVEIVTHVLRKPQNILRLKTAECPVVLPHHGGYGTGGPSQQAHTTVLPATGSKCMQGADKIDI